jgi:hypothetical protein
MKKKFTPFLMISLLAIFFAGCGTDTSPSPENLYPMFPGFSPDATPGSPNDYWLTGRPFTNRVATYDRSRSS